jgi:hypothetical protein
VRIDGDGKAIYELTLLLTPGEAREVIGTLESVLQVVPSQQAMNHSHVDDSTAVEGGQREVTLVVYTDPEVERTHDTNFKAG